MTYTKISLDNGYEFIQWDDNGSIRQIPVDESNSDYQAYLKSLESN